MRLQRIVGVTCLGLILLPLLVRDSGAQDSDTKDEAKKMVQGIIGRVNAKDSPEKIAEMVRLLGDLAIELREGEAHKTARTLVRFHPNQAVRIQAAKTLGQLGVTDESQAYGVVHDLVKVLDDPDDEVRIAVIHALFHMRPPTKQHHAKLVDLLKDKNPRIRRAAVISFRGLVPQNKELIPAVIAALDDSDMGDLKDKPGFNSVSHLAFFPLEQCKGEAKDAVPKLLRSSRKKRETTPMNRERSPPWF
jgi:hypothetical protein